MILGWTQITMLVGIDKVCVPQTILIGNLKKLGAWCFITARKPGNCFPADKSLLHYRALDLY
jgi:hypothetical protein